MTGRSDARRRQRAQPDDEVAEFAIDPTPIWSPDDWRLEPIFMAGPLWVDFEEADRRDPLLPRWQAEAPLVESADGRPLDPHPASVAPEEPPPPDQRASAISLLGSLGVHLLVLLGLVNWSSEPAETGPPIAVQLVVEQPTPAPPAPQDAKPAAVEPAAPEPKEAPVPAPPKRTPVVAPKPQPNPAPPKPPAPAPTSKSARTTVAVRSPQPEREVERPGPDFTRSDYFAQLVQLTRPHLGLLPLSFLAGRSGKTTLSILVLPDGTVAHIAVKQSSGYPDIDTRVEQIVAAVGRFPPLPPTYQGRNLELNFDLKFPDALAGP